MFVNGRMPKVRETILGIRMSWLICMDNIVGYCIYFVITLYIWYNLERIQETYYNTEQ